MKRKTFLKKAALGTLGGLALPSLLAKGETPTETTPELKIVGFNHLPNPKNYSSMKSVLHKANTRGHANHGWLDSHHTFSFANYYNPERMHFGALRVLNDDIVQGGRGFGTHPHDNMEIISIPLEGDLEHKDSMNNSMVIRKNDVQIMSAGTGVYHSEYNLNPDRLTNFLQIWVFPKVRDIKPSYDQESFPPEAYKGKLQEVVSPDGGGGGVKINQDAWFYLANLEAGDSVTHQLHNPSHGVYAFVIEGEVELNGQALQKRDGFGIWDTATADIQAKTNTQILLMEVPMQL